MSRRGEKEGERAGDRGRQALSLTGDVAQIHICPQRHLACVHLLTFRATGLQRRSRRVRGVYGFCVRLLCLPLLSSLEDLARS
jgi:hypothetical protein